MLPLLVFPGKWCQSFTLPEREEDDGLDGEELQDRVERLKKIPGKNHSFSCITDWRQDTQHNNKKMQDPA
jgi:hypothetical protein